MKLEAHLFCNYQQLCYGFQVFGDKLWKEHPGEYRANNAVKTFLREFPDVPHYISFFSFGSGGSEERLRGHRFHETYIWNDTSDSWRPGTLKELHRILANMNTKVGYCYS
jgi:hypothetical protein